MTQLFVTPQTIKDAITLTGKDLGFNKFKQGSGLVNINRAVNSIIDTNNISRKNHYSFPFFKATSILLLVILGYNHVIKNNIYNSIEKNIDNVTSTSQNMYSTPYKAHLKKIQQHIKKTREESTMGLLANNNYTKETFRKNATLSTIPENVTTIQYNNFNVDKSYKVIINNIKITEQILNQGVRYEKNRK